VASPASPLTLGGRLASILISLATALVILGASILPFLTPQWIHAEQDRAAAAAYFEGDPSLPHQYSDSIVHDLVLGGSFNVGEDPLQPLLDPREQAHMRDVRGVFQALAVLVIASAVWLLWTRRRTRGAVAEQGAWWRAVSRGGLLLAGFMVVVGALAVVAFDAMFEVFHELLFPAGSFTFDPAKERLVQLYPDQFWSDTTLALGVLALVASIVVAALARRRARQAERGAASGAIATAGVAQRTAT
jgi:integral membrane protein (TIGR01906 family)